MCNVLHNVLKGNCVSVESETIIRVYMLILYISNKIKLKTKSKVKKIDPPIWNPLAVVVVVVVVVIVHSTN